MAFRQFTTGQVFNAVAGLAVVDETNQNEITDVAGIVLLSNALVLQAQNSSVSTSTIFRMRVYSYALATGVRTEIYDSQAQTLAPLTSRGFLFPFPSAAAGVVFEVVATANDDQFTDFTAQGVVLTVGTLAIVAVNAVHRFVQEELSPLNFADTQ
ncbi:hypothetical protein [Paenibacillus gansuensis]|uniref:Uncharacterized protein n=1 Tax=Paenibacillus gansuensis TaxID=306542 RepID=A0ABW5PJX5_9BACL